MDGVSRDPEKLTHSLLLVSLYKNTQLRIFFI